MSKRTASTSVDSERARKKVCNESENANQVEMEIESDKEIPVFDNESDYEIPILDEDSDTDDGPVHRSDCWCARCEEMRLEELEFDNLYFDN